MLLNIIIHSAKPLQARTRVETSSRNSTKFECRLTLNKVGIIADCFFRGSTSGRLLKRAIRQSENDKGIGRAAVLGLVDSYR
jgi:hypothetical protein